MDNKDIGWAIQRMYEGHKVQRRGWNGKHLWIALHAPDANGPLTRPYIFMFTADYNCVPWLASQTDLLATDWQVV